MQATILNVDDNDIGRYARTRFLTSAGFKVLEAASGSNAISVTREQKPDLVLLDINLPDLSGFEVCRRLKESADTERIPVVFLSATRLADPDVVEGLESGADNYLREPIDPAVLVATVRALLRAKEAEEELARSNEQLRRFAFVVSHELQEPLRMVKSYTQLLARRYKGKLDHEADDYVTYTVDGVERMEKFIRDMLSYSQSTEGGLELRPFPLREAVDVATAELEETLREAGAEVAYNGLPTVIADQARLAQVFRNLIGNAVKYRSEAPPRIRVTAEEQPGETVVSVRDNGLGIDPQYAESIFVLFKRLHGRERSGSGVGLAVCKEIIELHGGHIWVEPAPDRGSLFRFTLPRRVN